MKRFTPPSYKADIDCPVCKFGTLIKTRNDQLPMRCIDCGKKFTPLDLQTHGVKPKE